MRGAGKVLGVALFLCVSVAAAGVCLASSDTAMRLKIGDKAPDLRLKDLQTGNIVTLSEFAGKKVVMLEFWATWCDICKREMPNLVKLQSAWGGKGFQILSVVLPPEKGVREIAAEKKLNYPVLMDSDLAVATKLYGLAGPIPLKVMIDHKGVIRYTHVGDYPPGEDELPFVIEDLLKEMGKGK
jgi:peroxiredoxin